MPNRFDLTRPKIMIMLALRAVAMASVGVVANTAGSSGSKSCVQVCGGPSPPELHVYLPVRAAQNINTNITTCDHQKHYSVNKIKVRSYCIRAQLDNPKVLQSSS